MANPEFKGTVVPKSPEPIVDPVPMLYEQFWGPWAQAWVRPPLMIDGTEITSAEDLEDFRTGLGLPGARRAPAGMLQT